VGLLCLRRRESLLRGVSVPVLDSIIRPMSRMSQLYADHQGNRITPPCEQVRVQFRRGLHRFHLATLPHLLGPVRGL
jgi:hypothetical protein